MIDKTTVATLHMKAFHILFFLSLSLILLYVYPHAGNSEILSRLLDLAENRNLKDSVEFLRYKSSISLRPMSKYCHHLGPHKLNICLVVWSMLPAKPSPH